MEELMRRIVLLLAASSLLVFASITSFGQQGQSSVRGIISDPKGSPIAGATVTLAASERNFSRTQVTNTEGQYQFKPVPPGTYRLDVEMKGFKKSLIASLAALVDTPTDVDVQMEVGSVTETVNITSAAEAPLNTSDATIGNTFDSRRISELPLNARNVVGLLSLQPGVTQAGYVNGGRADQANVTLDGVDVNEQQRGLDVVTGGAFSSVLRVTPDSVQEFRVTTTNPNADSGRSSGAQVSLVTKSGSNEWHGLLYEYHRNTVTTANDWWNNATKQPRPPLLRNIFGGAGSGPIKKDKAYFFFNYEGFREATSTSVTRLVPNPASIGQGVIWYQTSSTNPAGFPCGPSNSRKCVSVTPAQINAFYTAANNVSPGVSASAVALLQDAARRYPANDFVTTGDLINTAGYRFNATTPTKNNVYIGKFDFNLTDRQTLFVRGTYQDDLIGQAPQFPDMPAPSTWYHPKGIAIGHTWTLNSRIVNNARYGLTRLSVSTLGDSSANQISFRNVFAPAPTRTSTRLTPVHNFVDDVTWLKGNHSLQFGGNIRLISNTRDSFGSAYDFMQTNPSGYDLSGAVVTQTTVNLTPGCTQLPCQIFPNLDSGYEVSLRNALSAFIGRFSSYTANFLYGADGKILPTGSSSLRTFSTQEYDFYGQDIWRISQNLTATYGLRWGTSTPVYEANGFEIVPTTPLGDFFANRLAGSNLGAPYNLPITLDKGGKFYGKPGFYPQDWNNFAPSIAIAYQPNFKNWLGKVIGREGKSVFRGGFRVSYDHIGEQLAVNFDASNQLGFASALSIPVNTYNISSRLAPLFTGGTQDVRTFPGITFSNSLTFPLTQPSDQAQRIETSLDSAITTPYNYNVAFSYEREIGKGFKFQAAYVGRFARNLLAQRDVASFNNIRDPKSGLTYFDAMRQLITLRYSGTPVTSVSPIPFFENLLPGLAGNFSVLGTTRALTATQRAYQRIAYASVGGVGGFADYTTRQAQWDDSPTSLIQNLFIHPQYAALTTWTTVAKSNYNSAQFSLTQRLRRDISFDINYTYGHSLDNASGLQNAGNYSTAALIFNPFDLDAQYANSDFDVHIINANWLVGLPFGKGKTFFGGSNKVVNGIIGGWQLTGVFRWNSGLPVASPFGSGRWPTNWQISSFMVRTRDVPTTEDKNAAGGPNLFADPLAAFTSWRDSMPGEGGDRNVLRLPGYFDIDAVSTRRFALPNDRA
jgi:Carboxypeptidase regulatory-like domain